MANRSTDKLRAHRGRWPVVGWIISTIFVITMAHLHYGYFMASGSDGGQQVAQGKVISCAPKWLYFGMLSTCDVRTPGENHPIVRGDDWVDRTVIAAPRSQLGDARIGDNVWLSYEEGVTARDSDYTNPNGTRESASEWEIAHAAPRYGLQAPVQAALWIFGIWAAYRAVRAFRQRHEVLPPRPRPVEGDDKVLVIILAVLVVLSLGGSYLVYDFVLAADGYGSVATSLAWIGVVVLSLVGLACLIGAGTTWSSARKGKTVSKSDDDGNTQNGTLDELSR